jgi:hypothetical protein
MLLERPCVLRFMFPPTAGDPRVIQFLSNFLHEGRSISHIVLTEDADEHSIADAVEAKRGIA